MHLSERELLDAQYKSDELTTGQLASLIHSKFRGSTIKSSAKKAEVWSQQQDIEIDARSAVPEDENQRNFKFG